MGYKFCLCALFLVFLIGCSSKNPPYLSFTGKDAKTIQKVKYGKVKNIKDVYLQSSMQQGLITGATIGSAIGATLVGKDALSIIGLGALGTFGGAVIEKLLTKAKAIEIEVELKNGKSIFVAQKINDTPFNIGDEIRIIINTQGKAKIFRL